LKVTATVITLTRLTQNSPPLTILYCQLIPGRQNPFQQKGCGRRMPLDPTLIAKDANMTTKLNDFSDATVPVDGSKREWRRFLLLAFVGLPITMGTALVLYGFLVWFSQLLFFGPPA
jgi:nitrate reductase NapE